MVSQPFSENYPDISHCVIVEEYPVVDTPVLLASYYSCKRFNLINSLKSHSPHPFCCLCVVAVGAIVGDAVVHYLIQVKQKLIPRLILVSAAALHME